MYGPGEHDGRLLPSLIRAADSDSSLDLTTGTQQRDFTYVEDVAEGLLRMALADTPPGGVVNLATGKLTSVREFAEVAARILQLPHTSLRFGQVPERPEEMVHSPVTNQRLRDATGWAPATGVAEGIRRTAKWLRA